MTTVLIADDHQLLRQALRRAMEDAGLVVLGEAGDGAEAVQLVDELRPELVIMDVTMPVLGGIEATRRLHAAHPELPIVVLTMHDEDSLREEAVRAGASAFLSKDSSMQEVVATAIATAAGEALSAELASSILTELRAPVVGRAVATPADPPAHRRRLLDERGGEPPVHQRQDREEPPRIHLRQARRPGPHPGRAQRGTDRDHPPQLSGRPAD
jgi:DNA-binding NarL/FixJ family response regulator